MNRLFYFLAVFGLVFTTTNVLGQCINSYPSIETFDTNGQNGWSSAIVSGASNTWAFGTPGKVTINSAYSAPNAWVTGGLSSGKYNNFEKSAVVSPCYDLSTLIKPQVGLKVWWESEYSADGAVLQYSTDGLIWYVVGAFNSPFNWYNDNSIQAGPGGQIGSTAIGWSGTTTPNSYGSGGWKATQHDLPAACIGQPNVQFRIAFAADGSVNDDGFAFDDFVIREKFDINLGPDRTLCGGAPVTIDAGFYPGATYLWNNTQTTQSINVSGPGTYICTVTDSMGFKDRDTVLVTNSTLLLTLGPNQYLCPNQTIQLNSSNPSAPTHIWQQLPSGNVLNNNQFLSVATGGVYVATVSDNVGCTLKDTITIYQEVLPNTNFGPDQTICFGTSLLLDAGPGGPGTSYAWNIGPSSQTLNVSAPGLYICNVSSPSGCVVTDSINIAVAPAPIVDLGPDRNECGTFTLDAGNPGSSFQWNTNAITQSITLNTPGFFWVTVTNAQGCEGRDSIVIQSSPSFGVNIGPDRVICDGNPVVLNAGNFGAGYSFFWSTAAPTQTINVTLPGTYYVKVTNADGCFRTDTAVVTLSTLSVDLGPDVSVCNGTSVTINSGSNNNIYNWSNGATTPNITVNSPGTYWVSVLDALGCIINDTVQVSSTGNYVAGINAPAYGYLLSSIQFNDNSTAGATQWQWDFGDNQGVSTLQNPTYTYQSVGNFTVTLTSGNGICSNTSTKVISIWVTSLENKEMGLKVNVYPNPSNGNFTIDLNSAEISDIDMEILDLNGKRIWAKSFNDIIEISENIQLSGMSNGFYIVKLTKGNRSLYHKISIQ